ncbi:hypothetical protein AAHA92_08293 [Salvia divinorum]|uniref:Uncharacterized protein n=1 Tax=Salvia divinorum TaxID=28513 RepID=A0ABD1HQH2_SALDI
MVDLFLLGQQIWPNRTELVNSGSAKDCMSSLDLCFATACDDDDENPPMNCNYQCSAFVMGTGSYMADCDAGWRMYPSEDIAVCWSDVCRLNMISLDLWVL